RRLAAGASARLGLARDGVLPEGGHALHEQENGGLWYVLGKARRPVAADTVVAERTDIAWLDLAAGLAIVLGLGAPLGMAFRRFGLALPSSLLAGAGAATIVFSLATWTDLAAPRPMFVLLAAAGGIVAWRFRRQTAAASAGLGIAEGTALGLLV